MFTTLFKYINRRLWLRVIIPVSIIVIMVVAASLWFNISFQAESGKNQLKKQNRMLAKAVDGATFDALATGDNDSVRRQFKRLNERITDLKVYVYDFNGIISFSTDISRVGQSVEQGMDPDAKADLAEILETGKATDRSFHTTVDNAPFLLENAPILNEKRCFHCHGQRKVLGGITVVSSEQNVRDAIAYGKNVSIIIGITGLGVIILFVWVFFHFLVNKKVGMVLDATSNMRDKDFTHIYDIGQGDELNHILARINLVTGDLRETIKKVVANSDTIFEASSDLSQISENLNTASSDASKKATKVSTAAEEMSINNQSIADSVKQSSDALNAIASAIEEMSATVSEIAQNVTASKEITQKVVAGFDTITQVVDELGQRANDVDLVTDEIRSIAEQVGMLALNAKVEAARAGDAGKGFAVVAQEITELAADTNRSTVEADEKLQWIKDKAGEMAEKVSGLTAIVTESDEAISSISAAVAQQNATTREIAENISGVSSEITEVNSNVHQGAAVAAEIAKEITIVEQGSKDVQESSRRLNENAASLSAMAEHFMEMMRKFKV